MKRSLKLSAFLVEGYRSRWESDPLLHDEPSPLLGKVFYAGRWWKVVLVDPARDLINLQD